MDPANDYRLVFTGTGGSLSGAVYLLFDTSKPLATVNGTDSTYASGVGGLVVFDNTGAGNGLTDATFDIYTAAVPEPGTLALFALGAIALTSRFFRRTNP